MKNELNRKNENISNKEIKIVDIIKGESILFIKLSNNRKFLTNGILIKEFTEFQHFVKEINMNGVTYVIFSKNYQGYLIEFSTKEIILSFRIDNCSKKSENILKIGDKLFNLKTRKYIQNTDNLTPNTFCCLGNDLFLFDTIEKNILERRRVILNEKGEQLLDCKNACPYLYNDSLLLIDNKQEEIKIEKYKNGKINTEREIIIKKAQTKPHHYKGNICIVKNDIIYVINPNQEILKQFPLPAKRKITSSTLENDTLLMTIKLTEKDTKIMGINLINGKYFISDRIGIRPLDMYGPETIITITMDNITYDKYGRETFNVRLLDENFNVLQEFNDITNYDYVVCKKADKIWLKTKEGGILYNASKKQYLKTTYTELHYQFNDENTNIEYGFGFDETSEKLQIIDEDGNVLVNSIPYEQLGFTPHYTQFSFRYLNKYICIKSSNTIDIGIKVTKNSILDKNGTIIYTKNNTIISAIGNYFQIKEQEKTIYFNTLNGEFSEKAFIDSNDTPLIEIQNQFEITEDGSLILKHSLK